MLLGDGRDATVVTGSKNVHDGITTTFRSATFVITGNVMTFENTAGPEKNQAKGYQATVIYRCRFKGYQGTHYVHSQRQLIYSTVDAVATLQSCNIFVRRPMRNQKDIMIVQGRADPNTITRAYQSTAASSSSPPSTSNRCRNAFKTYLGHGGSIRGPSS
ncbi:unnamed protein product [Musa hybrid cultivar]